MSVQYNEQIFINLYIEIIICADIIFRVASDKTDYLISGLC